MQLSKREKVLIGCLVCFAAGAALIMLFIAPQLRTMSENGKLLHTLETQKVKMDETIAKAPASKLEILKLEKDAERLYDLMSQTKSYDISLILSEMLGRYSLTPVSLEFSDYAEAVPPGSTGAAITDEDNGDAEKKPVMTYALKRTAILSFTGAQANAEAFLDELTNYNISYIVSGYTLSEGGSGTTNEIRLDLYEFVKPEEWKTGRQGEGAS